MRRFFIFSTVLIGVLTFTGLLFAQERPKDELKNAVWLYEHENYEEALSILKKLRQEQPNSSFIAYYLGITYKQLQDFQSARPHLEAAAAFEPRIKNAVLELIDVLYQSDEIPEAQKWLDIADKEAIAPAQTAFLKGLVLMKEGRDTRGAMEEFERAALLDKNLATAVEYQKALIQIQDQRLHAARNIFQKIITQEPYSDMAEFADEYLAAIDRKEAAGRQFYGKASIGFAHDSNVVSRPRDKTLDVINVVPSADWRSVYAFQENYQRKLSDWFGVQAGYSLYYAKQFDIGSYDILSQDISLQPGIYRPRAAITFPVHYNYMTLNDKKYLQSFGCGNLNNIMVGRNQMVQFLLQDTWNNYSWAETSQNEERDSNDYLASSAWYWFFGKNKQGFLSLRYAVDYNDAKGNNWKYAGNRFTASATIPLSRKMRLSVAGDYWKQDYKEIHSVYSKKREDDVFTFSSLWTVELFKNTDLETQFVFVKNQSNIPIYEYARNIITEGIKYKF